VLCATYATSLMSRLCVTLKTNDHMINLIILLVTYVVVNNLVTVVFSHHLKNRNWIMLSEDVEYRQDMKKCKFFNNLSLHLGTWKP